MSWVIDAWGNLTAQNNTGGTCYTFLAAVGTNNQLQSGHQYDAAGNMTYDGFHNYSYDAENRIVKVDNGSTASYVYNENGQRVRKNTGSTWMEYFYGPTSSVQSEYNGSWPVQYVYAGSALIAEYTNNTTEFVHTDHLGSTRLVTAVNQSVLDSLDYLPFGQQVAGSSMTTHKFTSKERDAESGLDNFGTRYNASSMGRFMSPDPLHITKQKLVDSQQWNMYAYVRNNPLRFTDPTGMYLCADNNKCKSKQDKSFEKARQRDLKSKDPAVAAAAKAYGDKNTDNGVNVKFGDPGAGHDGSTVASVTFADGKATFKQDVTIRSGLSGTALDAAVGHEGVHVEDAQGFAATVTPDFHYDLSKNLTSFQTEMNAYRVTQSVWAASGNTASYGQCGGGQCLYGPGTNVDATTIMLLANPANGYNHFVDDNNGSYVNQLGLRQLPAVDTPNP